MSKYTQEELKAKAISALAYKNNNPDAYEELVYTLHVYTGLPLADIDQRIQALANNQ